MQMEGKEINLEITYTAKDYRPFLFASWKRAMIRTAIFVFVVLFTTYLVASHFVISELSETFRLTAAASLIVVPLLTVGLNLLDFERAVRAHVNRHGSINLEITENGVTSREDHRTATFEWAAYEKAVEYRDKFVIVSRSGGLLIPKRCFASPQSIQSFKGLLERVMNGAVENQ